ncbi:hypothetical protein CRM90_27930 [Mycobacterium sp. ENV421]|uniref:HK97 family phage prohead protease n=1 Tax=Mycobacterium sp. ENV421 TaxID=1213407 RepID=UPI000C9C66A3|nr:HK97 family phage prohead protease [Mycobacterium sp. ENV421]PND54432.1 hypothetical protein CRM90_27930 [Mycobacterium sp. ENV421]
MKGPARPTERLYTAAFQSGLHVETRSLGGGHHSRVIGGYAAVFNKRSHPMGGMREVVEPSFLSKSQGDGWPMVVARYEHDPKMLLGSTAGGTLQLTVDNVGLDYSVQIPESRSDVWELAERGDLPGSSFSFQTYQDEWRLGGGGIAERHLVAGRLIDVAPVAVPAYPDATLEVSYRSLAAFVDADVDDVVALAAQGELRSLLARTDLSVTAPPTVLPGVVQRSDDSGQRELELRRKLLDERAARIGFDASSADPDVRLLAWYRRKHQAYEPVSERRPLWHSPVLHQ